MIDPIRLRRLVLPLASLALLSFTACAAKNENDQDGGQKPNEGTGGDAAAAGGAGGNAAMEGGTGGAETSDDPYGMPAQLDSSYKLAFASAPPEMGCGESYASWQSSSAPRVVIGATEIYVAYQQTNANNQDPVMVRFDSGMQTYCEHHESSDTDGRAYGLAWNGKGSVYVVYTVTGGGTAFDSLAKGHWIERYGDGGGSSKVSVLAKVDPSTGAVSDATFITAKLSSGKTNTLAPAAPPYVLQSGEIEFHGKSAFAPLNPDLTTMCVADAEYPNGFRARFSQDLTKVNCSDTLENPDGKTCSLMTLPCE